jgi:hypothetical protein
VGTTSLLTAGSGLAAWTDLKIQKSSAGQAQYQLRFTTANGVSTLSGTITIP